MKNRPGVEPPISTAPSPLSLYNTGEPGLWVIGGPTATGKSALALALADRLPGVILSADSRQVYRGFDLGTAKPSASDRQRVPHYLIDCCDPRQQFTLAEYQHQAQTLIDQIHRGEEVMPLLVGGTGLYIEAVVKGLRIPPVAPQPELRQQLQALGQAHNYALLQAVDPIAAQRIQPRDPVRTLRALEVFYVSGQPLSSLQGEAPPAYPIVYLGLDCDPPVLEQRIARRTEAMVAEGLVAEVEGLAQRYGADLPLLQTLGYGEILRYLQGDWRLDQAIAAIVTHTRQFAKRQRTWFRHRAQVHWLNAAAPDLVDQAWGILNQVQ